MIKFNHITSRPFSNTYSKHKEPEYNTIINELQIDSYRKKHMNNLVHDDNSMTAKEICLPSENGYKDEIKKLDDNIRNVKCEQERNEQTFNELESRLEKTRYTFI